MKAEKKSTAFLQSWQRTVNSKTHEGNMHRGVYRNMLQKHFMLFLTFYLFLINSIC